MNPNLPPGDGITSGIIRSGGTRPIDNRQPTPLNSWIPWSFLVLLIAITLAAMIFGFGRIYTNENLPAYWPDRIQEFLTRLLSGGLITLILLRRPENIIGYLLAIQSLLLACSTLFIEYAYFSLVRYPGLYPGGVVADRLNQAIAPMLLAVAAAGILFFPNGRLTSPRWRWVLWLLVADVIYFSVFAILMWSGLGNFTVVEITFHSEMGSFLYNAGFVILLSIYILAAISGIQRFRNSQGDERLQLKWIAYALGLQILVVLYNASIQAGGPDFLQVPVWLGWLVGSSVDIAIAIAILKYRLYAIDIVIRRTLLYSSLTLMLGLVYYSSVITMQGLFTRIGFRQSSAAIVISTLVIATLFSPLRRRTQDFIDRRFYRRKYDAEKSLTTFSSKLYDQVELHQLSDHLVSIVNETMQPTHISLWLPRPKQVSRIKNTN